MRTSNVVAVAGLLVLGLFGFLAWLVNSVRNGPERAFSGMGLLAMVAIIIMGASLFVAVLGWSIGYVERNRHAHKTATGTNTVVRETRILDGRTPQAPQILTLPSAMDAYPASFVSEASQQRAQLAAPQGSGWAVAAEAWPDVDWAELPHAGVVAAAYTPDERSNGQGVAW